jgi:hypothetical protein
MPKVWQIALIGCPVSARTRCARRDFFYHLLRRAQDLDLHRLPPQRPLEVADPALGLAQGARGDHLFVGADGGRGPGLGPPHPVPDHGRQDVELAADLGEGLLTAQDALRGATLELGREDPSAVGLAWEVAHGSSCRILAPWVCNRNGEHSSCGKENANSAFVKNIRITALKLGTLINQPLTFPPPA